MDAIHYNVTEQAWYAHALARQPRVYHGFAERSTTTYAQRVASLSQWRWIHWQARAAFNRATRGLQCIHIYEGSWRDPDEPYWGGLQMDRSFMQTYGAAAYRAWGTADHWPVRWQLRVGLAGVRSRGYSPWPVTRHMCGL